MTPQTTEENLDEYGVPLVSSDFIADPEEGPLTQEDLHRMALRHGLIQTYPINENTVQGQVVWKQQPLGMACIQSDQGLVISIESELDALTWQALEVGAHIHFQLNEEGRAQQINIQGERR